MISDSARAPVTGCSSRVAARMKKITAPIAARLKALRQVGTPAAALAPPLVPALNHVPGGIEAAERQVVGNAGDRRLGHQADDLRLHQRHAARRRELADA